MSFFRREQPSVPLPVTESGQDNPFTEFLDENARAIQGFAQGYSDAGELMVEMSEDSELKSKVAAAASDKQWVVGTGSRVKPVDPEVIAQRYLSILPPLVGYVIKEQLAEKGKVGLSDAVGLFRRVMTGQPHIDELNTAALTFSTSRKYLGSLISNIEYAEGRRKFVAGSFATRVSAEPELIEGAHDFYFPVTPESEPQDQEYTYLARDFRDILAADLVDRTGGQVRSAVDSISDNPDLLLGRFAAEAQSKPSGLAAMAKMAVIYATAQGITTASVEDVLRTTRERWDEIDPGFELQLGAFVSRSVKTYQTRLREIARLDGSGRRKGLRMPVTKEDVDMSIGAFSIFATGETHRKPTKATAAANFLFSDEVLKEATSGGTETKPLIWAKKNGPGYVSDPTVDIDKMVLDYAGSNTELEGDVRRMLREISINPFIGKSGHPMYVRKGGNVLTETVDGKQVRVLEFSPQDRNFTLKSGKEGKRTRITYSVTSAGVHIFHVVHHDEFDRIYR